MKKFVLTVTLNPAVDEVLQIKKCVSPRGFFVERRLQSAGGKGINVSRVLTRLGTPTLATGLLGGPTGEFIIRELDHEGVKNDFVESAVPARINLTILFAQPHKMTRCVEDGLPVSYLDIQRFKKKFKILLKKCSWVVFAGRIPRDAGERLYANLIYIAQREGVRTFLDSQGRALAAGLKAKPMYIKPNLQEAQQFLRQQLNSKGKLKEAVRCFLCLGVQNVFITLGSRGAVGSDGRQLWLARPPRVQCVNPVGGGDAFIGGFISAFERNKDFWQALKSAVAAGTANALSLQPGTVAKNIVHKIAAKVRIEAIKF